MIINFKGKFYLYSNLSHTRISNFSWSKKYTTQYIWTENTQLHKHVRIFLSIDVPGHKLTLWISLTSLIPIRPIIFISPDLSSMRTRRFVWFGLCYFPNIQHSASHINVYWMNDCYSIYFLKWNNVVDMLLYLSLKTSHII